MQMKKVQEKQIWDYFMSNLSRSAEDMAPCVNGASHTLNVPFSHSNLILSIITASLDFFTMEV